MNDEVAMSEKGAVPFSHSAVEVALTSEPEYCPGVHSKAPASVPQEKTPVDEDLTSQLAALRAETVRLVVEARVAVMLVVEAYEAVRVTPPKVKKLFWVIAPSVVAKGTLPERSVETVRFVEEATVEALIAVVEAYGVVTAPVVGAVTRRVPS